MSPLLVASCYGSALVLALYLLWHFGAKRWYWHTISLVVALVIGLTPMNEFWGRPQMTLIVGWVFTFLFFWGVGALVAFISHHAPDLHLKHR